MNGGAVPAGLLNVGVISYWVLLIHADYIVGAMTVQRFFNFTSDG